MDDFGTIPVMYRDASNYKAFGQYVVQGQVNADHLLALASALDGDGCFSPAQIGLDHLAAWPSFPDEDLDHPWHEMQLSEVSSVQAAGSGQVPGRYVGTAAEFVALVVAASAAGWDGFAHDPTLS